MKNLTPEQIYWITLIGIALCSGVIGFACGFARGWSVGYDDAVDDEILDSKLVTRNSELPISGRFL